MSKINCPYCNHAPFRNESGRKWHVEHIHGKMKPLLDLFEKRSITDNPRGNSDSQNIYHKAMLKSRFSTLLPQANDSISSLKVNHEQELRQLKRDIEDTVEGKLSIFRMRDAYLFEQVAKLERAIENRKST